jgi:hypothetical protein
LRSFNLNIIDKVFILWVLARIITYIALWQTWAAFINVMGFAYNALGLYLLFRCMLVEWADYKGALRALSVVAAILAIFMVIEQITERNMFFIFGGVPEYTMIREGRLRSQGAFAHAINAGMFGATLFPLIFIYWLKEEHRKYLAIIVLIATLLITLTSSSSAPVASYLVGICALCAWPLHNHMRIIRWGVAAVILGLHFLMKAPVWALIARVDTISGSSGYHRYMLLDNAISRFDEWWLLGIETTRHWGYDMDDMINQYVAEATGGGMISLVLFIAIICLCFRKIGLMINDGHMKQNKIVIWSFGAALFVHTVGYFGIAYWDQQMVTWYMLLAMIAGFGAALGIDKKKGEPLRARLR